MHDDSRESLPRTLHALVAGGGSGGHVFPGLAVAQELLDRGWRVSWAGRAASMEERLVGDRGLPFHPVKATAVVGRGPAAKARSLATLAGSAWAGRRLVRGSAVDLVVGTGGFVSAPAVAGAWLAGRPALLVEPNARAGAANRSLSRLARAAALGWQGAAADFRCPSRVTGVPVRREFFDVEARPPGGPPRVLVLGGSQGARQLNLEVPRALDRVAHRVSGLEVVHQAGRLRGDEAREAYAAAASEGISVSVRPFLDDVAAEMARADLVISRAGAVTLAEICAAGRAALLVPLALAGAHQIDNASALERAGGAEVISSPELTTDGLASALSALLADPERLSRMGAAARGLAHPDAASAIADQALTLVEGD